MSSSIFKELKRRNVYKVGVAYLVLAWVVVQVTTAAVPALHLPEWINSAVFLFGAIGFPFALFFAWEFELTPDGVKRESAISPEDSVTAHTGRKLDFAIIGLLVVALGYFIYESRFAPSSTDADVVTDAAIAESFQEVSHQPEGTSIAVLPFVNMSSDKEQEYFSDGISEEILNVLAQIPKLHVTSRSSSFFYKGSKINISEVANKLGVTNILEGSVRKSGNRIRITAQLIEAETDNHLWSETYDRELVDIFEIQDEISAAIVMALKTKLGLDVKAATRDMSKVNLDAHNEYLQGRFYIEKRNRVDLEKALTHFDKAIELAPDYAPAWMGKAWAILFLSETNYGNIPSEISLAKARPAIEKALQLAPDLPEAHGVMGLLESNSDIDKAIAQFKTAIELNPNYSDAYSWYGNTLFDQPKKRLESYQKAVQLSPMAILANSNYGFDLIKYGRIDEASEVAEHMLNISTSHHFPIMMLGNIHLVQGNYAEAIIASEKVIKLSPGNIGARYNTAYTLATIGLGDKAASYVEGRFADAAKYWFKSDIESYTKQIRETLLLMESNDVNNRIRGGMEVYAENYQEASKYFKLVDSREFEIGRIYSYQQTGDSDEAQTLLRKAKSVLRLWMEVGGKYINNSSLLQPIELFAMEIAYLEGDIDTAIANLKKAMEQNYIVNIEYQLNPIYKKLRAHPDWPSIMAESNKRAAIQRELYLELIDEGDTAAGSSL